jgi:hypothetical protein
VHNPAESLLRSTKLAVMEATASCVASSPPGGRPTGPGGNLGQVLCAQYGAARAASNFASSSLLKSPALVIMTATASQCRFSIVKDIRRATRRQAASQTSGPENSLHFKPLRVPKTLTTDTGRARREGICARGNWDNRPFRADRVLAQLKGN